MENRLFSKPKNIEETGLSNIFLKALVVKHLYISNVLDQQQLSNRLKLSGNLLETLLELLKKENNIEVLAASNHNTGLRYSLTEKGTAEAVNSLNKSGYIGPVPVPVEQYRNVVRAQSVSNCKITQQDVSEAFSDTTVNPVLLNQLGPAMHSGRAILIYGLAGTGKTYICKRLTRLLGEAVYIPYAIAVGDSIVQLYDPVIHHAIEEEKNVQPSIHLHEGHDPRYVECYRPVAVSGGELTLDMLEIDHDKANRLSQAPLQLKANNGMYIIDDLGRQRVPVIDLFNRWIVPLEEKHDYLSMDSGKRVQFPFDVILIFSSNINPADLADEAFLRRLGYKIKFPPIDEADYTEIWTMNSKDFHLTDTEDLLPRLFKRYKQEKRPLLPCHPRDLLGLVQDQCQYHGDTTGQATQDRLDLAWDSYFINLQYEKVDQ